MRVWVFVVLVGVVGCGAPPPGDADTDRMVRVVSEAIVYPRQSDAAGLARAALATRAAQNHVLDVLEYTDLRTDNDYLKPRARLKLRVRHDGAGFGNPPRAEACYSVTFSLYEAVAGPERIDCPPGAAAVTPPAAPSTDSSNLKKYEEANGGGHA